MNDKINKETIKLMREAIKKGNIDLVKELNRNNEGLLCVDTAFGSWLHVAADCGEVDIAKYLIECGMEVNKNGGISGGNPVHSAARNGNLDIIQLLHKKGAEFDVSEATKNPLFGAICNGHYEVAKYLIDNGIDITTKYHIGKMENVDAYEYAKQFGQMEIANYLKTKM